MRGCMKFSEFVDENKQQNTSKEEFSKRYEELKDLSENQLMERLQREIARQKESGEFNYGALMDSLEVVKNFVSYEQYENMKKILSGLNEQK